MLQFLLSLAVAAGACAISEEQRDRILAMEWEAFDQGPHGFRSVASGENYCPLLAAELIEGYLHQHEELTTKQRYVSEFHAGQLFAGANERSRALAHFYRGFNPHEDPSGDGKWNAYVRATIAFLEKDRETLEASLRILENHQQNPMNAVNVRLVRGFAEHFDSSYDEAVRASLDD
jgi:hypothetical protein